MDDKAPLAAPVFTLRVYPGGMKGAAACLRRWRALDAGLSDDFEGVSIRQFARRWNISTRTVHRDLRVFRQLGQEIVCERDYLGTHRWTYGPYTKPLFVASIDVFWRVVRAGPCRTLDRV